MAETDRRTYYVCCVYFSWPRTKNTSIEQRANDDLANRNGNVGEVG